MAGKEVLHEAGKSTAEKRHSDLVIPLRADLADLREQTVTALEREEAAIREQMLVP